MAKHILDNVEVICNSVDLSDHVQSVEYVTGINTQPASGMSETQDFDMAGTLTISPITVNFFADFAASETYATLQSLRDARTTFTLTVKPTSAADSATNPKFSISVFIQSLPFVSGARGDAHMHSVVFQPAGTLTIDVTP